MDANTFGYIDIFPQYIRKVFIWLCQDVVALHRKWDFYIGLCGKPENYAVIDLLPQAFNVIEESVRTDITMAVCRLSDPIKSCGRENLNFRALEAYFDQDAELKVLIEDFVSSCDPVKLHRNKLVGHSDKIARIKPEQAMIPQIKKSDIETIIKKAEAIINHVAWQYGKTEFGFGFPGDSGATNLIYWLKKGLDSRKKLGS
jgi:hypothetical protein